MSTGIEWTDETWNPVVGCTRVSAGCDHCYAFELHDKRYKANRDAARIAARERGLPLKSRLLTDAEQMRARGVALPLPAQYDVPFSRVQLMPDRLTKPLHWKKPRKVFVNSMSDLFHPDVPDGFIVRVLMTMRETPWHTYQILTKRPERASDFFRRWADLEGESFEPKLVRGPAATRATHPSGRGQLFAAYLESLASETGGEPPPGAAWPTFDWMEGPRWWSNVPLPNCWLGTSVEDQASADERIPHLLATPAAVRFLSCEPLLGPVDLTLGHEVYSHYDRPSLQDVMHDWCALDRPDGIDWVICGGESGPHARPFNIAWARDIRDQCSAADVAFYMKQLGSKPYLGSTPMIGQYQAYQLHSRHGSDPEEWPEDLRVREFPV